MGIDKNTIIGFLLIFGLLMLWQFVNTPSQEQIARQKQIQDSIQQVKRRADSLALIQQVPAEEPAQEKIVVSDSARTVQLQGAFGVFAPAAAGTESTEILENDFFKITFTNKGGRIQEVLLKKYFKEVEDSAHHITKQPLYLLNDEKNAFEYYLPIAGVAGGMVNTGNLFFNATKNGHSISFKAPAGNGRYFEQTYTIGDEGYKIDYDIKLVGLKDLMGAADKIKLKWVDYLQKLERGVKYERLYSTTYFKPVDDGVDYCSATKEVTEDAEGKPIKWMSNSNQFFNSSLIAATDFQSGLFTTKNITDDESPDLRILTSELEIPIVGDQFNMQMYVGPNEFDRLRSFGVELEEVISFGWSIFGTINRWVIRPIFNFLSRFVGNKGIVILLLTLFIKLALFPFNYKYVYSQSKMAALKPQIEKIKEKFKGDSQQTQVETMQLYREYGVNPLGGCMPMLLQMPVWFALYRFFPASIAFRQEGFLWATDLSSYESAFHLPFSIPAYGDHVSIFTLLWTISTLIYTHYNAKNMDMSANPSMKYMQYLMPLMFLFFFNNYASGLTLYLAFSSILNIIQTVGTKKFLIDHDKIQQELEAHKKKPKKKSGFSAKFQQALKEQQRIQAEREAAKRRTKKK